MTEHGPGKEPDRIPMPAKVLAPTLTILCSEGNEEVAREVVSVTTGESLHLIKRSLLRAAELIADELTSRHKEME